MKMKMIHMTSSFFGLLIITVAPTRAWMTYLDQRFSFSCHEDQTMTYLESVHSNSAEDRKWSFKCGKMPVDTDLVDCKWSGYVNNFDQSFNFQCSNDKVLIGIESYHSNSAEDRRFKFMCCKPQGYIVHGCKLTGYVNVLDGHLKYQVPSNRVLVGVDSYHDNNAEDRRFEFNTCVMSAEIPGFG